MHCCNGDCCDCEHWVADEVEEFLQRRFEKDNSWLTGNCYYLSVILKDRFPDGDIYYDDIRGHFLFKINGAFYDWCGEVTNYCHPVKWDELDDALLKERIIRDCIL